jgi:hypothetical protein
VVFGGENEVVQSGGSSSWADSYGNRTSLEETLDLDFPRTFLDGKDGTDGIDSSGRFAIRTIKPIVN